MNHETEVILGQANMNFIQGQTGPAKEGFLEVIRQDPYVHSAWVALASCYDMEGDVETARQMRFFGAHIEGDADAWKELAKEFRWVKSTELPHTWRLDASTRLDGLDVWGGWDWTDECREQGQDAQALYCFRKALRADPSDIFLLLELTGIYRQQGKTAKVSGFPQSARPDLPTCPNRAFSLPNSALSARC
jgi:general transcription factor 3C polypeptide 3 (transcription factor C subunit 4)